MDDLGWNISPPILGNQIALPPCLWSGHDQHNLSGSITDNRVTSGEADLDEALFSSSLELQGIQGCEMNLGFGRMGEMAEIFAPATDSTNNILGLDFLQHQEAAARLPTNSVLPRSIGTTWVEALPSQICSFPSNELQEAFGDIGNDEDGALSAIFSSGRVIRNLSHSGNVSSGDSEINQGSCWMYKESEHHSNPDEAASQGSSNPESSKMKHDTKRKMEDCAKAGDSCRPCDVLQSSSSTTEGGFQINFEDASKPKKARSEKNSGSSSIDFRWENTYEPDTEAIAQVKEMIYRAAALRPISIGVAEGAEKPKRKNVRISSDPQTVAARHRRERISERLRVLQRLVPGGGKMDTASMLDEAASYLKFLKSQVSALETLGGSRPGSMNRATAPFTTPFTQSFPMQTLFPPPKTLNQGHP